LPPLEFANSIKEQQQQQQHECPCPQVLLTFAGNEEYQQQSKAEQGKEQQLSTKTIVDLVQANYSALAPCIARTLLLQPWPRLKISGQRQQQLYKQLQQW